MREAGEGFESERVGLVGARCDVAGNARAYFNLVAFLLCKLEKERETETPSDKDCELN